MIKDKIALVTGAASGIGYAVAEMLSAEGAKVVMADVNQKALEAAVAKTGGYGFAADLSRQDDCRAAAIHTLERFGRVDILVNVAGLQTVCAIEDFPEERWNFMISLMLTAPFLLTKYCWPSMKASGWGRIVHLNSIHGLVASEYKSAYVSAKHGLMGLTKTTALEGGPLGITVNSICPAYVITPLVEGQIASQAKLHNVPEEKVIADVMLSKAAIKTMLKPETVAECVKFLCSDAAANITGTAIPIDGGWTAG